MITVKKDQTKFIPILLSLPRGRGSRNWIPDQVGNDGVGGKRLDIVLAGENASVEILGLLMANGKQQTALEIYITHAAPGTKSVVKVKGVLRGQSTFAFKGNVKIKKGAKGSDAYLRSDVLLFDEAKMGDDTPALEILEPDVKAGHAATIGKVDENMVFYLMSRGLSRKQAEGMIIDGFVDQMREVILNDKS